VIFRNSVFVTAALVALTPFLGVWAVRQGDPALYSVVSSVGVFAYYAVVVRWISLSFRAVKGRAGVLFNPACVAVPVIMGFESYLLRFVDPGRMDLIFFQQKVAVWVALFLYVYLSFSLVNGISKVPARAPLSNIKKAALAAGIFYLPVGVWFLNPIIKDVEADVSVDLTRVFD
jgi:hypothetical protein